MEEISGSFQEKEWEEAGKKMVQIHLKNQYDQFFRNHCCHEVISSTFAWKMKRRHSPLIGPGTGILIRSQWMYWK